MGLEKTIRATKRFGGKFSLGMVLTGILFNASCKQESPNEITVKEEHRGGIVGKVTWDYNRDGIFTGVSGARIIRTGPDYPGYGLFEWQITETTTGGVYSYPDVPIGTHSLSAKVIIPTPYSVWSGSTGAAVTKGNVTTANIQLRQTQ
ncbi:MAG: hypothetical protein WD876_01125 [Candidatus Pacearchaeota archaeon]